MLHSITNKDKYNYKNHLVPTRIKQMTTQNIKRR